jgi:hypothetical protein
MFKTIGEAYLVLLYLLMHLSLFACDSTCMFPVNSFTSALPRGLHMNAASIISYVNIDTKYLMLIGQFLLMGDLFFVAICVSKLFAFLLKRFFVTLLCILASIVILKEFGLI